MHRLVPFSPLLQARKPTQRDNFAWIGLPERGDVDALGLETKKEGVATLGGGRCVAGEADAEAVAACGRCVRVCFAYLDEEDIEEGIRRLARAVRKSVK